MIPSYQKTLANLFQAEDIIEGDAVAYPSNEPSNNMSNDMSNNMSNDVSNNVSNDMSNNVGNNMGPSDMVEATMERLRKHLEVGVCFPRIHCAKSQDSDTASHQLGKTCIINILVCISGQK